ncbi:putative hydrolase [Tricharina praecox]|uniref:putative hydrolase n=1 Tax=Tricharina praecox TaxID=43433 RepID=UPI00221EAC22|nr:putative hydrolase [Tricharina praecox]KAI5850859.1 putative hydrolase [Tricharina praecox]
MAPSLLSQKLLCFDVYGTLIDWETGIYTAALPLLSQLSPPPTRASFLSTYARLETLQQTATPGLRYSQLLSAVYAQLAAHYSLPAPSSEAEAFGASIGDWPAFADSADALQRLKASFKLVVLSNVDRESFANSLPRLGGEGVFDLVLTAEDIGGYKPALRNFEVMLEEVQERFAVAREEVCCTAQSLFHDHAPAKRLGLVSAWIDRQGGLMGVGEVEGAGFEWRFETLGEMAEAVEREKGE